MDKARKSAVSITVDPTLWERAGELAEQTGRSRSQVMQGALAEFFAARDAKLLPAEVSHPAVGAEVRPGLLTQLPAAPTLSAGVATLAAKIEIDLLSRFKRMPPRDRAIANTASVTAATLALLSGKLAADGIDDATAQAHIDATRNLVTLLAMLDAEGIAGTDAEAIAVRALAQRPAIISTMTAGHA